MTDSPAMTKIRKARLKLLFSNPFFGSISMNLPPKEIDADWLPTAAVDGRYIYYNPNFINGLEIDEVVFVWAHEILHCVMDHFGRRSHRDPEWWNMATDYVINGILVQEKIGKMPEKQVDVKDSNGKATQRVGLYDSKYLGWTSEAVYDDLQKRQVKKQMTIDVHLELGKDSQDGEGRDRNKGIPIEVDDATLKEIREALKDKVLQAANTQGKLPASIARMIDFLVEPKINWRDYIRETIQSQLTADYAYQRPNRRHSSGDIIFPNLIREETIDVEITIDQSGSISDEMARDFLSEVYGITQQYGNFTIAVSCFDTKLYNRQVFTPENIDEIMSYKPMGGGGTDFVNSFWKYLKENSIEPKLLIVFTDLECHDHGPSNYCETLWLINNPWNKDILPQFGTWVRYDRKDGAIDTGVVN